MHTHTHEPSHEQFDNKQFNNEQFNNEQFTEGVVYYRPMDAHEVNQVSHLAASVFLEFAAQHFEPEGVAEFLHRLSAENLAWRTHNGSFVLVAFEVAKRDSQMHSQSQHKKLLGMIEVSNHEHISLLFVDSKHQGQGIARKLIELAERECRSRNPGLSLMTVSATPNAVSFYQKVGFVATAAEKFEVGMRFTPMVRRV